jgi:hypothetical protein
MFLDQKPHKIRYNLWLPLSKIFITKISAKEHQIISIRSQINISSHQEGNEPLSFETFHLKAREKKNFLKMCRRI